MSAVNETINRQATQIEFLEAALAAEKAEKEKALAEQSAPPLSLLLQQEIINDTTELTFACCADPTRNGRVLKPSRKAKEAADVDEFEA